MQPGPELDRLVAEKVMGWRRMTWIEQCSQSDDYVCEEYDSSMPDEWCSLREDGLWIAQHLVEERNGYYEGAWTPSADIKKAWEVVEKLKSEGWSYSVSDHTLPHATKWTGWHLAEFGDFCDSAETAPHAICLAALKAVQS
jgi:hypothetical protein